MLPLYPSENEFARRWSLTPADLAATAARRGPDQRRRLALQLCVMRLHGRFLDDSRHAPIKIVNHLSRQRGLPPVLFLDRAGREPMERVQAQRIRRDLSLSRFDKAAEAALRDWLREGALEGRSAAELLNAEVFNTRLEARVLIEQWHVHYNIVRPHSSLGYQPPALEVSVSGAPMPSGCSGRTGAHSMPAAVLY